MPWALADTTIKGSFIRWLQILALCSPRVSEPLTVWWERSRGEHVGLQVFNVVCFENGNFCTLNLDYSITSKYTKWNINDSNQKRKKIGGIRMFEKNL